jgi:hypothetical protein
VRRAAPLLALAVAGCATYRQVGSADAERTGRLADTPEDAFGAQVIVRSGKTEYHGELIACSDTTAFVLANGLTGREAYRPIPLPVPSVEIPADSLRTVFIVWSAIGLASTASHGYFAAITAPSWGVVGGLSTYFAGAPERQGTCAELWPYARFPQGMPPRIADRFGVGPTPPVIPPRGAPLPDAPPLGPPPAAAPPPAPALLPTPPAGGSPSPVPGPAH